MVETAGQLVPYNDGVGSENLFPNQGNIKSALAMDLNASKIDPQELGKLILALQDEIKIIKLQLENLPGYSVGRLHT